MSEGVALGGLRCWSYINALYLTTKQIPTTTTLLLLAFVAQTFLSSEATISVMSQAPKYTYENTIDLGGRDQQGRLPPPCTTPLETQKAMERRRDEERISAERRLAIERKRQADEKANPPKHGRNLS